MIVNTATNSLISHSKDGIIKIWSFATSNFPSKSPVETLCDHEGKIRCGDCYDKLLGTFDSEGKVTIRDLRNPQECIATLNIADVNENQQFCFCDSYKLAVGNSTAVEFYNIESEFVNMIDLEDKICFMAVQGAHLLTGTFLFLTNSPGFRKSIRH